MNYPQEYLKQIKSGEIITSQKIRALYERECLWMETPPDDPRFIWHYDQERADRHINFIEKFCKESKGKNAGKHLKLMLWQKAFLSLLYGWVTDEGLRRFNEVFFLVGRKNGKALSLDTKIPTPNGWTTMGELNVGDVIFSLDGKPATVIAESEIFNKPMYRVTFEDGTIIKASEDHLWEVQTKKIYAENAGRGKPLATYHGKPITDNRTVILTTSEMLADFAHVRKDGNGTEYKYRVPMNGPVEYTEKDLPIDPYTFGVWLGDGSSAGSLVTCSDDDKEEMMRLVSACGHHVEWHNGSGNRAGYFTIDANIGNPLNPKLRRLGVLGDKHIPQDYLQGSIEQRLALLQGLMDTDGFCEKRGQCEFAQKSEVIVDQVRELLASLGIKSSKRRKEIKCNGKICYAFSVLFYTDKSFPCFRMERKKARLKDTLSKRMSFKSIVNIESIPIEPSKCIAIDDPRKLYLVGESYTATHNTELAAAMSHDMLLNDGEAGPEIYAAANAKDQAMLLFNEAVNMRSQSPALRSVEKKRRTDIYTQVNFGLIKAIASKTDNLDGLNASFVIQDEIHEQKNSDLYDVLKQSQSFRDQPLYLLITTNGFVREAFFDDKYADYSQIALWEDGHQTYNVLPIIYELDDRNEWTDETKWIKANPGLGVIKKMKTLKEHVEQAKRDQSFFPTLMTKDFNVPENSAEGYLTYDEAVNETLLDMDYLKNSYAIGGCDLSSTTDLTCATLLVRKPDDPNFYVLQKYFLPEARVTGDAERSTSKEAPYKQWAKDGWLQLCEGSTVDFHAVTEWFVKMVKEYNIRMMGCYYDAALSGYWREDMDSYGFPMYSLRQGPYTWTYSFKLMRGYFHEHRIIYDNNPMLRWCLLNTGAKSTNSDGIESIQPVKISHNRRIDGTVSLLNAMTGYHKVEEEYMRYIK